MVEAATAVREIPDVIRQTPTTTESSKERHWFYDNHLQPEIIQGGMGVAISDWKLARSVAIAGEKLGERVLGVVSGTALPVVMVDRLQKGDLDSRRALRALDEKYNITMGQEIIDEYYVPKGDVNKDRKYKLAPKPEVLVNGTSEQKDKMNKLAIASAFAEVWLAKQGHNGPIGINELEKVQLMHLPTMLGAMLADVDFTLVGAGIPDQFPKLLDNFMIGNTAKYKIDVEGLEDKYELTLDPREYVPGEIKLKKPKNLAIISLDVLAKMLSRNDGIDGFIVEGPDAGGHNAPPRGKQIDENREPIYTEKDIANLVKMSSYGKPFWLAGSYGTAEKLKEAKENGAMGVQVGTAFALCNESGFEKAMAQHVRDLIFSGELKVMTDADLSPSGFPFKKALIEGTLSQKDVIEKTKRACTLGYLVHAYQKEDNSIGFRCPAEKPEAFTGKGGDPKDVEGKVCLCRALTAACGHAADPKEPVVVTLGKDLEPVKKLTKEKGGNYFAEEVIVFLKPRK